MEALSVLFIIGSMWFWLSVCAFFFIVLALSENDHNIMAGIALVAFLAGVNFFNPQLISFTLTSIVIWSAIYFVAGGAWSFVKWFSFLKSKADRFEKLKMEWIVEFKKTNPENEYTLNSKVSIKEVLGEEAATNFRKYLTNKHYLDYLDGPLFPEAKSNKEKIVTWILYWPTSLFWTVLNDPMVRLANWIYDRFGNVYTAIADKTFAKVGVKGDDV